MTRQVFILLRYLAPGPLPLPGALHLDVVAAAPVFAPSPPRLVADPVQEILHLVLGLEADEAGGAGTAAKCCLLDWRGLGRPLGHRGSDQGAGAARNLAPGTK